MGKSVWIISDSFVCETVLLRDVLKYNLAEELRTAIRL